MDALYRADQSNLLSRAHYYLDKISGPDGKQTGITAAEATAQYHKLEAALAARTTAAADKRSAAAVDAEEAAVCSGLYRAYAGLLHRHSAQPELVYACFPLPASTAPPPTATSAACASPTPPTRRPSAQ